MKNPDNADSLFVNKPDITGSGTKDRALNSILISSGNLNIIDISNKIIKRLEAWESQYLDFNDVTIKVSSNSQLLISKLGLYYDGLCIHKKDKADININAIEGITLDFGVKFIDKQPDPGKSRVKERYFELSDGRIVKKTLTGMVFIFGDGINIALGECIKNCNQVVNFINNRYMEHMLNRGCLLFHSAAVGTKERGAAICGFAGAGKSTLALKVLEKGFSFISNDRLLAKNENLGVMIYGVPKLPRINPGTIVSSNILSGMISQEELDNYSSLDPDKLWDLEKKYDVPIDSIFGKDKFIPEAKLQGLFVLNWKRNAGEMKVQKVRLDERSDLFLAFMKSPGLFYNPIPLNAGPQFKDIDYLKLLSGCDVFEFTGGIDFEQAAIFIENFLNKE